MELLSIAKLALYGIFLNYYCYYTLTGSFIPYGTILFFGAAFGCVLLSALKDRYVYVDKEIKYWVLYTVLSLLTMIFAMNFDYALDSLSKYVQRLMIIIMIVYICEKENSIKFALRLLAIDALGCAISVLYTVDDIQAKLSISSGANLSANDVGALMAFGCFAVLFAFGNRKRPTFALMVFRFASVIALLSVIFLAGSRKSIYAVVIMVALLVLLCGRDYLETTTLGRVFMVIILGLIAFEFVNQYLTPHMEGTNLYVRMFGRGVDRAASSDEGRWELYVLAIEEFIKHPFVGIGFNNFTLEHGNYTHSTYVEPLACSGMIGFFYLAPYVRMLKRQIELIKLTAMDKLECIKQKELLAFYMSFLFIGIGIPYMYKDNPCIILALFIASQHISYKKIYEKMESRKGLK